MALKRGIINQMFICSRDGLLDAKIQLLVNNALLTQFIDKYFKLRNNFTNCYSYKILCITPV